MGWEVKINMSGQSNDCLWVCSVKMKKNFIRAETGHISEKFWGHSVKQFESFSIGITAAHQSNCFGHILANIN